jgi:hypothetical protein
LKTKADPPRPDGVLGNAHECRIERMSYQPGFMLEIFMFLLFRKRLDFWLERAFFQGSAQAAGGQPSYILENRVIPPG